MRAFPGKSIGRGNKAEASVVLRRQVPVPVRPTHTVVAGRAATNAGPHPLAPNGRQGRAVAFHRPDRLCRFAETDLEQAGSRDGWLLLFVDVLQMRTAEDEDSDELG